jgi:hypothetical protein
MDELAFHRTIYQITVSLIIFPLSTLIDIFIFMTATVENPDSHRNGVTEVNMLSCVN